MFSFVKDMWLRLFATQVGEPLDGKQGWVQAIVSRGYYGLWFYDGNHSKFVWFGDLVIASVTWPLMIGPVASPHSNGDYSERFYRIGLGATDFTVRRDEKNITLTIGNCSVVFGSEQIEKLSAILDGLKL